VKTETSVTVETTTKVAVPTKQETQVDALDPKDELVYHVVTEPVAGDPNEMPAVHVATEVAGGAVPEKTTKVAAPHPKEKTAVLGVTEVAGGAAPEVAGGLTYRHL